MNLTNNIFWDNFWKKTKIPAEIDLNFSFERCMARAFSGILSINPNVTIFEIGCAPGRWLAYFNKKFSYQVSGIDYSALGCQKTRENFNTLGIKGEIYQTDFLTFTPPELYDIVVSLGVIEHFEDPYPVLKRHLDFLKPGGKLILGIPNFRGANYLIQKRLDKTLLDKHNLKIMNPYFYYTVAKRFSLTHSSVKYIDGFAPSLFFYPDKKGKISIVLRGILKIATWMRKTSWFDEIKAPFFSSYLLGVLYKR